MKLFIAFLSLLSLSLAHEFATCKSQKVDQLGVEYVSFTPDPPKSGLPVEVAVKGRSSIAVTAGKLHVDVRVLGIVVESQVLELCDVVKCPLKAGEEYEGKVTQQIPEGTPDHMGATVRLTLIDENGHSLSCLESYVEIGPNVVDGTFGTTHNVLEQDIKFLFEKWKLQYPKLIANLEVFAENLKKIFTHNSNKESTFKMAMNEFGSMTLEEFTSTRLGYRSHESKKGSKPVFSLRPEVFMADPPAELDWTTRGVVTEVKNQGACGSCWAFSAVASLESAYAQKYGKLVEFSEQELVSCDMGDYGCQGGLMDSAFDWIEHSSGGLCSEADYSYTSGTSSARGECLRNTCTPVSDSVPKGYIDVPQNEAALLAALNQHGPVSVAIEADQAAFQFYHSGVLTGACGNHLDHGVLLVGYGVDAAAGTPFWKVKNSWGAGWGEAGYVRILRGKRWPQGGECGIASAASYPIL